MRAWLTERAVFHVHDAPIYVSWLNQVEGWFAVFTSPQIRRGSFASAQDLVTRISAFVAAYRCRSPIFVWTAPPADLARLGLVPSGSVPFLILHMNLSLDKR